MFHGQAHWHRPSMLSFKNKMATFNRASECMTSKKGRVMEGFGCGFGYSNYQVDQIILASDFSSSKFNITPWKIIMIQMQWRSVIDVQNNVKLELVPIQKRECSEEFAYDDGPHGGTFFPFLRFRWVKCITMIGWTHAEISYLSQGLRP